MARNPTTEIANKMEEVLTDVRNAARE